jgi:colicin import membrane protein
MENAVEVFRTRINGLAIVDGYKITAPEEAERAAAQLKDIHQLVKDVESAKRAELAPIALAENNVRSKWAPVEQLAAKLKTTAQAVLGAWQMQEQRRIANERAAAEAAAAKERARLEQEAREAREKAAAASAKLEAAGKVEQAQARVEAAEQKAMALDTTAQMLSAAIPVPKAPEALSGVRAVETWEPQVVNVRQALAALVADEFVDLESLIDFKKSGLNALAKQYKDKLGVKYPGLKATPKLGVSATGR